MKRKMVVVFLIAALMCQLGCQSAKKAENTDSQEVLVTQEAILTQETEKDAETEAVQVSEEEKFGPEEGFLLSRIQKEAMGEDNVAMIERIVEAVCQSEEYIDFSDFVGREEQEYFAIEYAKKLHPLVNLANITYKIAEDGTGRFNIDYGCTVEEHKQLVKEFNERVQFIIEKGMEGAQTKEDYAKAVFEFMAKEADYDYGYANGAYVLPNSNLLLLGNKEHNVYTTIMTGKGICWQFAEAYSFLMKSCGVEAVELIGTDDTPFAYNGPQDVEKTYGIVLWAAHEWNLICLDNQWYAVDVTFAGSPSEDENIYNYWGMSEESDMKHYYSHSIVGTAGYTLAPINRSQQNLADYVEPEKREIYVKDFDESMKTSVWENAEYEYTCGADGKDEISITKSGHQYFIQMLMPAKENSEGENPEICYYLGSAEELKEEEIDKITACITWEIAPNPEELASFLNELCKCVVIGVEENYNLSPDNRELKAKDENADLALCIFFQNDGVTDKLFDSYIIENAPISTVWGTVTPAEYEGYFYERVKAAPMPMKMRFDKTDGCSEQAVMKMKQMANVVINREYTELKVKKSFR